MLNAEVLTDQVEVQRKFIPGPFGQIHVREARPINGNAAKTPLFLFPPTPHSSDYFKPFMAEMATDRKVVAVDTPGYGDSAPTKHVPSIGDFGESAKATIDAFGFGDGSGGVDVLGYHAGSLIAIELAIALPANVRRLVLPGLPFFVGDERKEAYDRNAQPDTIDLDGSHLMRKWEYSKVPMQSGVSLERTQEHFTDLMQSYPQTWRGYHAAFTYPSDERIGQVAQPVLLISVNGSLKRETEQAKPYFRDAAYVHLNDFEFGVFDLGADVVAKTCRDFLDV